MLYLFISHTIGPVYLLHRSPANFKFCRYFIATTKMQHLWYGIKVKAVPLHAKQTQSEYISTSPTIYQYITYNISIHHLQYISTSPTIYQYITYNISIHHLQYISTSPTIYQYITYNISVHHLQYISTSRTIYQYITYNISVHHLQSTPCAKPGWVASATPGHFTLSK